MSSERPGKFPLPVCLEHKGYQGLPRFWIVFKFIEVPPESEEKKSFVFERFVTLIQHTKSKEDTHTHTPPLYGSVSLGLNLGVMSYLWWVTALLARTTRVKREKDIL